MNFIPESNQGQPQHQNQASSSWPEFTIPQQDVLNTLDDILNKFSDEQIATLGIANIGTLVAQLQAKTFPNDLFTNTDGNIDFLTQLFHKLDKDWSDVIVNETISISQVGAYQKCFISTLKAFASGFFKDQNAQSFVLDHNGAKIIVLDIIRRIEATLGIRIPSRLEDHLINIVSTKDRPFDEFDELEDYDRAIRGVGQPRRGSRSDRRIDFDSREEERRANSRSIRNNDYNDRSQHDDRCGSPRYRR